MKKVLFLIVALTLMGAGCNSGQQAVIQNQQKQIEDLTKKVEEAQTNQNPIVTTTSETPTHTLKINTVITNKNKLTTPTISVPKNICTSWDYTNWRVCINGTQERSWVTAYPAGCTGGNPILAQPCTQTNAQNTIPAVTPSQNNTTNNTQISDLLKIMDDQLAEKQRQNEIALQQMNALNAEMKQKQAPIQAQIDAIEAQKNEAGCDIVDMSRIIGSIAQQCSVLNSQIMVLTAQISAITSEYSAKMGFTPSTNFTTQQSVSGQHYEFYYNGNGSGSIYNTNNPAESYKIYCAYGACNMYGQ